MQVVKLAQVMGLVKLGSIAIDGSKFKANSSRHKAMSYGRMVSTLEALEHELKLLRDNLRAENSTEMDEVTLKGEIARRESRRTKILAAKERIEAEAAAKNQTVDPKAQKSFNDLDALPNFNKKNGMNYAYNLGIAVDEQSQIVVACEVHDNCSDQGMLEPLVESVIANLESKPEQCLADAGFNRPENISALEELGITPITATGQGEKESTPRAVEAFQYDAQRDKWRCPKGKILKQLDSTVMIQITFLHHE